MERENYIRTCVDKVHTKWEYDFDKEVINNVAMKNYINSLDKRPPLHRVYLVVDVKHSNYMKNVNSVKN